MAQETGTKEMALGSNGDTKGIIHNFGWLLAKVGITKKIWRLILSQN